MGENECQISQNYILHMKIVEFYLYNHNSYEILHLFRLKGLSKIVANTRWDVQLVLLFVPDKFLQVTRGAHNPILPVVITHALHAWLSHTCIHYNLSRNIHIKILHTDLIP